MIFGIDFRDPWLAVLLPAIPALFGLSWWLRRRGRRDAAIRFSNLAPFRRLPPTARLRFRHVVPVLRGLALALLALALMRPQKGTEMSPESSKGISILMAVDRSGSMLTEDFEIDGKTATRMEAVKKVFRSFVAGGDGLRGRPADEIGIVTFAGYPIPLAPLTLDHGAVLGFLDTIQPYRPPTDRLGRPIDDEQTRMEEGMTAIGDGLALAADRLKDLDSKSKVIILLSDGRSNFGQLDPVEGAELAKTFGIKIHAIGVGRAGTVMRKVQTIFGTQLVPQQSDLDEETLEAVAEKTGGRYWNAEDTKALAEVYREIDSLERADIESSRFYRFDEKFQWLAIAALALLAVEVVLSGTVFRRIP